MANHLDLEEQEQLDELKHFWKQYGNAITWVLIVALSGFAAWNGYQQWDRSQAAQAAAMYDEVERVVATGDVAMAERAFGDMKERFARTVYAQQAGLLLAKLAMDKTKPEVAKSVLTWVAEKSTDDGYAAVAKLRLAGLLIDEKSFDAALKLLDMAPPAEFVALFADRKGDVYAIQSKPAEAKSEYLKAYAAFDERSEYRRLVEIKLNALGGHVPSDQEGKK
jgi:predicted negative regulator of RcsB-dependent stress response